MDENQPVEYREGQELNEESQVLDTGSCLSSANNSVNPHNVSITAQDISDGEKPGHSLDEMGQHYHLFGSVNEPIIALTEAWHSLATDQCMPDALWKAIDGEQVTLAAVTSGDIIQLTSAAESLHQQMLDITKHSLLPNFAVGDEFALMNSRANVTAAISEALLAQSETALGQFTKATLIPQLNSLSSAAARQLASYVNSSFKDMSSSLAGIAFEAMPKLDLSDLLPKYTVSDLFSSLDLDTHLLEITRPMLGNIGASLTGALANQLQEYFESSPFHMGQLDLGEDISVSIDSLLPYNHVDLATPIYLNRRERYLDEQQWLEIVLHKEIQTEEQLLQGQQEIMARLERLERRISQTTTPHLPDLPPNTPPIPGQKNTTWEDVFDWYYGVPRRWCLDLKDLADKIGMAYGTVKKEHSLYKSDKKLPLQ